MKFHYVYQKIVDLKTNEKTQAEWLLTAAVNELRSEQKSLEQLIQERSHTLISIQNEMESCASMIKLQELQNYVQYLDECISHKLIDIERAETNVENKKSILNSKMVDEKVWLKAKDKSKQRFMHDMLLREQNELDEIATVRFAMRAH